MSNIDDKVRCPSCRGSKKVAKLGGIVGECNTCDGNGTIQRCDKVMPIVVDTASIDSCVVTAVANCLPVTTVDTVADIKVGKKVLYKHKKG